MNVLANYFIEKKLNGNLVVVATDIGISKRARDLAERLNAPLAIMEKRRVGNADRTETLNVIGEVEGKMALTLDDEIDTAGSLVNVVKLWLNGESREYIPAALTRSFPARLCRGYLPPAVKEVVVTDTIPLGPNKKMDKMRVLSMAPLLGEAIHRIHTGMSIGAMFA